MKINFDTTKCLLDKATVQYNRFEFIEHDPIQVPHLFARKEDIEIAAFLTASIAWGNRKAIIKNSFRLMDLLDNAPYASLTQSGFVKEKEKDIAQFVHRTFNGTDCMYFLKSLQHIYLYHGGLEQVFTDGFRQTNTIFGALHYFRNVFLRLPHEKRVEKHLANVMKNASAKRLNMFLRWMVRYDENGVDFGLWKNIPMAALMLPLRRTHRQRKPQYGVAYSQAE